MSSPISVSTALTFITNLPWTSHLSLLLIVALPLENFIHRHFISGGSTNGTAGSDIQELPRREVIRRLRDRGEPILLFGESELQAFQRLRRCEILEPEMNKVSFFLINEFHRNMT